MQEVEEKEVFSGKSWFSLPFFYLLITAGLGVFLRILQSYPIEIKFINVMHAHSHLALLGWCNTALMIFLVNTFVPAKTKRVKVYHRIFYAFQFAVFGMLFFFPFQGYSITTITFSSFFIVVSYFFAFRFLKDTTKQNSSIALSFARIAICFFVLSSIGPWSLGPLNANGLGGSDLYFNMIYFYLHFLYNGYFLFALFALLFAYAEKKNLEFNLKQAKLVRNLLVVSTILAYALSVLWIEPPFWVYGLGIAAVLLQLLAVGMLLQIVFQLKAQLTFPSAFYKWMVYGVMTAFLMKVILQTGSVIPDLASQIAIRRDWVLAYLHLVFLGIVTPFILLTYYRIYKKGKIRDLSKWGLVVFLFGFVIHELLMVLKGGSVLFIDYMGALLLGATGLLFVGVLLLNLGYFRAHDTHKP